MNSERHIRSVYCKSRSLGRRCNKVENMGISQQLLLKFIPLLSRAGVNSNNIYEKVSVKKVFQYLIHRYGSDNMRIKKKAKCECSSRAEA